MHSFIELSEWSTEFALNALNEAQSRAFEALQTRAQTSLVKTLQMIQLQKAIIAIGVFSIFEAMLQDSLGCKDGFAEVPKILIKQGGQDLLHNFLRYSRAVNVLKHGRGRSYDQLLSEVDLLPFRVKRRDENFFFEGDVAEVSTLVEVDDHFVKQCVDIIQKVSLAMKIENPDLIL